MLIFTLAAAGFVIKILRQYRINYMFIFELDPQYKITHVQLFRVATILFAIWAFCLMCQTFILKLEFLFEKAVAAFTLAVLVVFIFMCVQPFHCIFLKGRVALAQTIWNILISPFGMVRFRHFFFADIITSFIIPLKDLGYMGCFFTQGGWLDSIQPKLDQCPQLENYLLSIAFLPYWFRLAQCFRRYHDTKMKIQLLNAGKYFSMILIQFANIFRHKLKGETTLNLYFIACVVSTAYAYGWDLYMDWGLLRSKDSGSFLLRPKFLLPRWFYYYAALSNLALRLAWLIPLVSAGLPQWVHNTQLIIGVMCMLEAFRRAQWAILRLENEQVNNFEKYRTFMEIPAVRDEDEEEVAPNS